MDEERKLFARFEVDCKNCLAHGICENDAPQNFAYDESSGCYRVIKQPDTEEEERQCRVAVMFCPVSVIREITD